MGQSALGFIARTFQGATGPGQVDPQRALWDTSRHGNYYASVYGTPAIVSPATPAKAGSVFRAVSPSAVAITAALATTYTGLCLSNPAGSGLNLILRRVSALISNAPAAVNLGLITGWSAAGITAHTTPVTSIINAYVGAGPSGTVSVAGPTPVGLVDAACTLVGTPAWDRWLSALASGATGASSSDINDDVIIPPGGYAAIGNLVSLTTSALCSFTWEELQA